MQAHLQRLASLALSAGHAAKDYASRSNAAQAAAAAASDMLTAAAAAL